MPGVCAQFKGLLPVLGASFSLPWWVEGGNRIALVSRGVEGSGWGCGGAVERHSDATRDPGSHRRLQRSPVSLSVSPDSRSGCKALTTRCSRTSGAWACPWWSCPSEGTPSPRRTPRSWRPYLAGPWSMGQKESLTASHRAQDPPDVPSVVRPESGPSSLDGQ